MKAMLPCSRGGRSARNRQPCSHGAATVQQGREQGMPTAGGRGRTLRLEEQQRGEQAGEPGAPLRPSSPPRGELCKALSPDLKHSRCTTKLGPPSPPTALGRSPGRAPSSPSSGLMLHPPLFMKWVNFNHNVPVGTRGSRGHVGSDPGP